MTLQASMEPEKLQKLQRQQEAWQRRVDVIHNPARKNAHDVPVIEQQNETRRLQRELDKQQQLADDETTLAVNAYLEQRERDYIMAKKAKEREDLAWSAEYLAAKNAREYDITHPDNSKPIRSDTIDQYGNVTIDPSIGVSAGQWFKGEDLAGNQRRAFMKHQYDVEMQRKMQENRDKRQQEFQERRDEENKRLAVNRYLDEQEKQQNEQRKQIAKDIAQDNLDAVENARRARQQFKQQELDEYNKAVEEFHNTRLMTGQPLEMKSKKPIINSEHKGLTDQQKRQYEADQEAQRQFDRDRKHQSYMNRVNDDHYTLDINRELMLRDQRAAEQRKQLAMEIAEENRRLAIAHQTKKATIKRDIGENDVYDYFHDKWEKSAR